MPEKMPRMIMNGGKINKVMMLACGTLSLAVLCVVIAFTTPYWLVSDGLAPVQKFERLGLWEACFKRFKDIHYRYDREFRGCKWIFDEDYNFIQSFLSPPFFVAVQVLFTIGLVCLLLALIVLMIFTLCLVSDKDVVILMLLSCLDLAAGVFCMIAVSVFGALGDERHWMPDPDHNNLSWSFAMGVIGALLELISGTLFMVEACHTKRRAVDRNQQVFTLNQVSKA